MASLNIATLSGDYAVVSEAAVEDFRGGRHGSRSAPATRSTSALPFTSSRSEGSSPADAAPSPC